jgi:alkylated DNA repair dioxygenase AlkB
MRQLSLLDLDAPRLPAPDVPGLAYVEGYVTREEEAALVGAIDREPWLTDWQRRRQMYGLSYGNARLSPEELRPLPEWVKPFAARVVRDGWLEAPVANVVVNEYLPGQGIGMHLDYAPFGPTVVAISLGSACFLDLYDPETKRAEVLDVAPRSLWVLSGEARSRWMHGIAHRKTDMVLGTKRPRERRVSVTMRTAA